MMGMPAWIALATIGAVSGMPGLFTISEALRMSSSVCWPSSQLMPRSSSICLYLSLIFDMSETNTSKPSFFANTAAPTPLSAAPKTTILFMFLYSFLSHFQGDDGERSQNDGGNPEAHRDFRLVELAVWPLAEHILTGLVELRV